MLIFDKLTYAANLWLLHEIENHANCTFVQGDICDRVHLDATLSKFAPDAIIHLAAESHVDRSITDSSDFVRTNIVGTHSLLEAALAYWEGVREAEKKRRFRFLHVSTDEVFGSLGEAGCFSETTPYDPRSPYAASKAASDHLARAWFHTYGLPVVISNASNNYGPYQFPEKFIPTIILRALEGAPLPIYGDGLNVRDWIYVDDHAAALERILAKGRIGQTYAVGGRSERRNLDVARTILEIIDELGPGRATPRSEVRLVEDRPGHDRRYAIDCTKLESELGWRARETFESGMRRTVQWYLERRDWWGAIKKERFTGERLGLRSVDAN